MHKLVRRDLGNCQIQPSINLWGICNIYGFINLWLFIITDVIIAIIIIIIIIIIITTWRWCQKISDNRSPSPNQILL